MDMDMDVCATRVHNRYSFPSGHTIRAVYLGSGYLVRAVPATAAVPRGAIGWTRCPVSRVLCLGGSLPPSLSPSLPVSLSLSSPSLYLVLSPCFFYSFSPCAAAHPVSATHTQDRARALHTCRVPGVPI